MLLFLYERYPKHRRLINILDLALDMGLFAVCFAILFTIKLWCDPSTLCLHPQINTTGINLTELLK